MKSYFSYLLPHQAGPGWKSNYTSVVFCKVPFIVKSTYWDHIISIKQGKEKVLGDTEVMDEETSEQKTKIGHKEK